MIRWIFEVAGIDGSKVVVAGAMTKYSGYLTVPDDLPAGISPTVGPAAGAGGTGSPGNNRSHDRSQRNDEQDEEECIDYR